MRVSLVVSCLFLLSALSLEAVAGSSLKGLLARTVPDTRLSGWNPELLWSSLEPAEGQYNFSAVDAALAKGLPLRLRVWAGVYEPKLLRDKLGAVIVQNDQTRSKDPMVPYWKSAAIADKYWTYYENLQVALRNHTGESNPLIHGIQISGTMFVYSEPFLHQFGSKFTRKNVVASKWTAKKDKAAQIRCINIHHKVWTTVPQMFAFNAYQYLYRSTQVRMDPAYVGKFITALRNRFGKRAVIANHSIREAFIGQQKTKGTLYWYLKRGGNPLYFQTATWDRISKRGARATQRQKHDALVKTINWAIAMGAQAVELPDGHNLKLSEITSFTLKLKRN